jgi:hypothetical protein
MNKQVQSKEFEKLVKNKFDIYNSLFLNLPFPEIEKVGTLIPILQQEGKNGFDSGKEPIDILDSFFKIHTNVTSETQKIDFMFKLIQYVERQIVLFDSGEEAKNVIYFIRNYFYDALGELYSQIKSSLSENDFNNPHLIQLGFRPGSPHPDIGQEAGT